MSEEKKLNGTVIVTYRCNARCSMCNRYKAPSKPEEEISIETIKKLPKMYFTNITGGEPFIRTDLKDIVRELYKKSDRIVISTLKKPTEVVFNTEEKDIPHENTMDLIALSHENVIDRWRVLSVGGGAIEIVGRGKYDPPEVYDLNSFSEISAYCKKHRIRIPDYVERVEGPEIFDYLKKTWAQMKDTVQNGLDASGTIPGGLNLQRKAKFLFRQRHIDESPETRENRLVCAFAYAVSEENACGHTIVTAPTCGSSGVVPAVLTYMQDKRGFSDKEIVRALATAGIVGNIVKQNASISGAECGCQAEIGTASAMGAAALCYLGGGDAQAVCHAAAIAIKSMLGLVCDPIAGLVEVPCVKRNAAGAMIAMSSADMALAGIRSAVPPDEVILAMREVGDKMDVSLKETGVGGVAGTPFGQKIAEKMEMG